MSKGMGTVQRAALEALQGGMLDSIAVAAQVYGHNPVTASEAVSVRRALRVLAEVGQVEDLGRGWRHGRRMWALPTQATEYRERVQKTFGHLPGMAQTGRR